MNSIPPNKVQETLTGIFQSGVVGLQLPEDISFDDWLTVGQRLRSVERSMMWCIGDWINFGERKWGEKYKQAITLTGYDYKTLCDASWVSRAFELSRRRDNLSWSHHRDAAALSEEDRDVVLTKSCDLGWSTRDLRDYIRDIRSKPNERREIEPCAPCDIQAVTSNTELVVGGETIDAGMLAAAIRVMRQSGETVLWPVLQVNGEVMTPAEAIEYANDLYMIEKAKPLHPRAEMFGNPKHQVG